MKTADCNRALWKQFRPLGFLQFGAGFARKAGDLIQSCSLKRTQDNGDFSFEFGVCPLCMKLPVSLDGGVYETDSFSISESQQEDENVTERFFSEAFQIVEKEILPFFNRCCECGLALSELWSLEKSMEKKRLERLRLKGMEDCAIPFDQRFLCDPRKYYIALKAEDFSFVRRFLEFHTTPSKTRPNWNRKTLEMYEEHFCRLREKDVSYFKRVLLENEADFRRHFFENYPRCAKQWFPKGFSATF